MGEHYMAGVLLMCALVLSGVVTGGSALAGDGTLQKIEDGLVIRSFDSLYEPSAVVTLPDGNVMVFEDEGRKVITTHRIEEDEHGVFLKNTNTLFPSQDVSDIEGAALGKGGTVIAITSYSHNKKGQRSDKREQFLHVHSGEEPEVQLSAGQGFLGGLKQQLLTIDTSLGERSDELNIEGLTFTPGGDALWIGLRTPIYQGKAIIVKLKNPYELGQKQYTPQLSGQPILLGLGGAGVRAMTYEQTAGHYFFANEVKTKKGNMRPRLWRWNGDENPPVRMKFRGLKGLKNIEGMTFVQYQKSTFLLLICDDGNKKKKHGASYVLISTDQLQVEK